MYSVGDILYSKSGLTDKTIFYIVSDVFINYFGDTVYQIENLEDDEFGATKIREISKFMEWLHKADDLTLF
jgi:hypothetical protein